MMPEIKPDHPADHVLQSALVENILSYADNPGDCARYITTQIRELIGVRLVALISADADNGHGLLSLCPPRKEAEWNRPEIQEFVLGTLAYPGPRLVDHLTEPAGQGLSAIGIGTSFVVPLMVGADRVGMLILLGLLNMKGAANILDTLIRVSRILALVLKNSFLYRDLEHTVAARTTELETLLGRLRQELEKRQRVEEKLLITQFSVDTAADAIFWIREDGSYSYANKAGCDLLGYASQDFLRLKTSDLNPDHQGATWREHWQQLKRQGFIRFETALVKKDGARIPVEIMANYVQCNNKEYNCAFVRDCTERLRAEEELRRSAREWSAAMDASEDVIYLLDLDRHILRANKAFYQMTRSTPESALGRSIVELVHPGGTKVPCPLCQAQEEQRELVFTMEPDHPHNPAGRPFEIALRMVRDDAGRTISMLKTWHDLTHERQVQAELTAYRDNLEELVRTRTAEIEKKKAEVVRLNKLFVGRELRMIELKQQIKELEERLASRRS